MRVIDNNESFLDVEVNGEVVPLNYFLKNNGAKGEGTLLEQAMDYGECDTSGLRKIRVVSYDGVVSITNNDDCDVTISNITNARVERYCDTNICDIVAGEKKYRIESWSTLFQSRDLFLGSFDREYFGYFYEVK